MRRTISAGEVSEHSIFRSATFAASSSSARATIWGYSASARFAPTGCARPVQEMMRIPNVFVVTLHLRIQWLNAVHGEFPAHRAAAAALAWA